jgi:hypothetical protein
MIFKPAIGEVSNSNLGVPILNAETLYYLEGAELKDSISTKFMDASLILPPCELIFIGEDKKYKSYKTTDPILYTKQLMTGVVYHYGVVKVNKNTMVVEKVTAAGFINSLKVKQNKAVTLIEKKMLAIDKPNLKTDFIYNGKAGQIIKFTYREFINDLSRPAFTQDIQYDLNDSNIIGFKSFQAEIIEASNTNIKYKILSVF